MPDLVDLPQLTPLWLPPFLLPAGNRRRFVIDAPSESPLIWSRGFGLTRWWPLESWLGF
jgi:hypothetical protein